MIDVAEEGWYDGHACDNQPDGVLSNTTIKEKKSVRAPQMHKLLGANHVR